MLPTIQQMMQILQLNQHQLGQVQYNKRMDVIDLLASHYWRQPNVREVFDLYPCIK